MMRRLLHGWAATVLAVCALVALAAPARAQDFSNCSSTDGALCATVSEAVAAAKADAQAAATAAQNSCAQYGWTPSCADYRVGQTHIVYNTAETGIGMVTVEACGNAACTSFLSHHRRRFPHEQRDCSEAEPYQYWIQGSRASLDSLPGTVCSNGCRYTVTRVDSFCLVVAPVLPGNPNDRCGVTERATPTGDNCTGTEGDSPDGEMPNDGQGWHCDAGTGVCFDPNDKPHYCTFNSDGSRSACVPQMSNGPGSQDGDGDGIPDGDDISPGDPNNGEDDGRGDESDNYAAGGANCDVPPVCRGDGILCNSLHQQWRTRCAVEKLGNAATGEGGGLNVRIGGVGGGTGNGDGDDFDKAGERAAIDAANAGAGSEGLEGLTPGDAWSDGGDGESFGTGRFGGGGGCPAFPAFSINGVAFQRPEQFCTMVGIIRLLLLASCLIFCASLVLRA